MTGARVRCKRVVHDESERKQVHAARGDAVRKCEVLRDKGECARDERECTRDERECARDERECARDDRARVNKARYEARRRYEARAKE